METTLTIAPKGISAIHYVPEQVQRVDTQVPKVKAVDSTATLPADKVFVAQVVNARLSGTAFPENPGEIVPPERVLKPYNMPMLPAEKEEEPVKAKEEEPAIATGKKPAEDDAAENPVLPELKLKGVNPADDTPKTQEAAEKPAPQKTTEATPELVGAEAS